MRKLLLLLLISTQAFAGLPPTSTKANGDSSFFTTFQFEFPNFTKTRVGTKTTFNILGASGGGTGFGSFAVGDMLYANTTTTLAKVAACADGLILKYSSGIPTCSLDNGTYAATDWVANTPTFTGFGTVTNIDCQWRRDGSDLLYRCKYDNGTNTAVEARVDLPSGLTSAGTGVIPTIQKAGDFITSLNTSTNVILIEPSKTYVTFGLGNGTTSGLTKQNGTSLAGSSTFNFIARIPIAGWSTSVTGGLAVLEERKTNGTPGDTSVSSTYTKRNLTTIVSDPTNVVTSLSSGAFTLSAGTYKIEAQARGFDTGGSRIRLRNTTDSTTTLLGLSVYGATGGGVGDDTAHLGGQFTITASKTFEIQHYVSNGVSFGFGRSVTSGDVEIFTHVEITKVQ